MRDKEQTNKKRPEHAFPLEKNKKKHLRSKSGDHSQSRITSAKQYTVKLDQRKNCALYFWL